MSAAHIPVAPQPWRTVAVSGLFAAAFVVLVSRLQYLQVEHGSELAALGERQRDRRITLPAPRGSILAADGTPLAVTSGVWNCLADTAYMDDKLYATICLAGVLGVEREALRQIFESGHNGRIIARHVPDPVRQQIEELKLAGIYMRPSYKRDYVGGRRAAHVLGYTLQDGSGGGGLEYALQAQLAGQPGYEQYRADARNRSMVSVDCRRVEARPGADVHVTIDTAVQDELYRALVETAERTNCKSICGIVLEPQTGAILAMASLPDFDPNEPGAVEAEKRRDRNLAFIYESGSTIKPLVAGMAVADGLFAWDSRFNCENGRWRSPLGRVVNSHPHSLLSLTEVVAKSDNIGMAKIAIALAKAEGPGHFFDWMWRFGFGQRTGIELPGEQYGILPAREKWDVRNLCISASFGHGLSVTPIQMAMAHAAVANQGVWLPARLVDRIQRIDASSGDVVVERLPPAAPPRRVLPVAVADGVEASMAAVMTSGTGKKLQIEGYTSAGKTGTTDVRVNGRYLEKGGPHIGSFVGWAPARPGQAAELLCLVVVDQPRKADGSPAGYPDYFGSATAGPVVQRMLSFALQHRGVPPDRLGKD